jgi:hypothetical protein
MGQWASKAHDTVPDATQHAGAGAARAQGNTHKAKPGAACQLCLALPLEDVQRLQELPSDGERLLALTADYGVKLVGRALSPACVRLLLAIARDLQQRGVLSGQLPEDAAALVAAAEAEAAAAAVAAAAAAAAADDGGNGLTDGRAADGAGDDGAAQRPAWRRGSGVRTAAAGGSGAASGSSDAGGDTASVSGDESTSGDDEGFIPLL